SGQSIAKADRLMMSLFSHPHPLPASGHLKCQVDTRPGAARLEVGLVILVLLILTGLLISYLGRQRSLANEQACAENLRRLGAAILGFHEENKFLPAARIAPGYATWAVQIAPRLQKDSALVDWDLAKPYAAQTATARTAVIASFFCPARPRSAWESAADG